MLVEISTNTGTINLHTSKSDLLNTFQHRVTDTDTLTAPPLHTVYSILNNSFVTSAPTNATYKSKSLIDLVQLIHMITNYDLHISVH